MKIGDRVRVNSKYPDLEERGETGCVTDVPKYDGYVQVALDKDAYDAYPYLFKPNELDTISTWMNETNCAGLRSSASAQTRAEAIMAMGPVKMVKRIIALEDEITVLEDELHRAEADARW